MPNMYFFAIEQTSWRTFYNVIRIFLKSVPFFNTGPPKPVLRQNAALLISKPAEDRFENPFKIDRFAAPSQGLVSIWSPFYMK